MTIHAPITRESFIQIITSNILITIKNGLPFESKYKNNFKLVNSLIYVYGIIAMNERNINVSDFYDEGMLKRVACQKCEYISYDLQFADAVFKALKELLESCDYIFEDTKALSEYIEHEISKQTYDSEEINKLKNEISVQVKNAHDIMNDILDKDKEVTIPFYQREYVWSKELIENFIIEISSDKNEMLNIGNILISIENDRPGPKNIHSLVDGQQRITSLILIMNHISKILRKVDLSDFDLELQNLVDKCSKSSLIDNLKNNSNPIYISSLKKVLDHDVNNEFKSSSDYAIEKNYEVIANYLNQFDGESNKNIFIKLTKVLSIITYDSISDEIELFINTNSSRKPLSNYDLIRSYLISKIPDNVNNIELKKLNDMMDELTKLLKFNNNWSEKAEDMFFILLLNYYEKIHLNINNNQKDLFKRFKMTFDVMINSFEDLISLMDEIISLLKSYRVIKNIDTIEKIYLSDFILSLGDGLKTLSIYDMFLLYFVDKTKNVNDEKKQNVLLNQFRNVALILEEFEIKWKIFQFGGDSLSNVITRLFIKFVDEVDHEIDEGNFEVVFEKTRSMINSSQDDDFFKKIITNEKYNDINEYITSNNIQKTKIALKIINRVAFNLFNNNSIEYKINSTKYFNHSKPTIEHIFPKSYSKWEDDDKTNALTLIPYLENIGNKFIFNKDENSSAGNKKFKDKIAIYEDYNDLKLDHTLNFKLRDNKFNLLEKDKWTVKDIILREEYIISNLLKIWEQE